MNKLEKYFKELSKIDGDIAIINDKPKECYYNYNKSTCKNCRRNLFKNDSEQMCSVHGLIEWLAEEYIEKPELTLNEYKLCQILKKGWLARNKFNGLILHVTKPSIKDNIAWISSGSAFEVSNLMFEDVKFEFIKWEDEKPWSVEDLLRLDVK